MEATVVFGFGKKRNVTPYDKTKKKPVIRSSICTGEQVAGFKDLETGRFYEVMLLRNEADLKEFMAQYAVEKDEIGREW